MADDSIKLFGFEIKRSKSKEKEKLQSIVPPVDEDGAGYITAAGSHFGTYVDLDGTNPKNDMQSIQQYRGVSSHPEVDAAVEDIVNESISSSEQEPAVSLDLSNVEISDNIKKLMQEEFDKIMTMLNSSFKNVSANHPVGTR